jgi:hypothetical protein
MALKGAILPQNQLIEQQQSKPIAACHYAALRQHG